MSVISDHSTILNIDIQLFLNDYSKFIDNQYQKIIDYYSSGKPITKSTIDSLDDIVKRSSGIINSYSINRDRLSSDYDSWELLSLLQDIHENILTIKNSKIWFKSDKDLSYNTDNKYDYILKQGQTLESLAGELGYSTPQDSWVDLALDNDLIEEDYSPAGGVLLKVSFKNNLEVNISTVQDAPRGKKVYGKDISKQISYVDDDLYVLDYDETINQSFGILISLTKGSVPEFPRDGIDKSIVSSNINSLQYPVLFRQLSSIFVKDDSFKDFSFTSIKREQDSIFIEAQASTRLNEVLEQRLAIG